MGGSVHLGPSARPLSALEKNRRGLPPVVENSSIPASLYSVHVIVGSDLSLVVAAASRVIPEGGRLWSEEVHTQDAALATTDVERHALTVRGVIKMIIVTLDCQNGTDRKSIRWWCRLRLCNGPGSPAHVRLCQAKLMTLH